MRFHREPPLKLPFRLRFELNVRTILDRKNLQLYDIVNSVNKNFFDKEQGNVTAIYPNWTSGI